MKALALWFVFLVVTMIPVGRAEAQGFIIPELGSRMNGMGAAIGRPDDLSAIYHNPGALALLEGTQVAASFGAVFLNVDLRLAPWPESDRFLTEPVDADGYYPRQTPMVFAPMPMLGASTNLWSDKVVGALGVYVPNAAGADFGRDAPSRYHIIDAYVFSAFFTAAVAYRPFDWLAVGAGASAVYVRVQRRSLLFPIIDGQDYSPLIGSETEINLEGEDVRPAFSLGIQVWPHRTVSLGCMLLSRYDVALEGPLTVTPGAGALPQLRNEAFTDNTHVTEIVAPWIFGFGANWDITPWLEVGADFRLYLNSAVKDQVTTIKGEILPTLLPDGRIITPKNLHNSIKTGGGFIFRPPLGTELELLTGMHYDNSASPDNTVEVSAPSFDLFTYHIGARWQFHERFRAGLFYAHYWYLKRRTTDSITDPPTNFVGSGYSHMITLVLEARVAPGIGVSGK